MDLGRSDDPRTYHFLEMGRVSPLAEDLIATNAQAIWETVRDPTNCLHTRNLWALFFQAKHVPWVGVGNSASNRGGYRLSDGTLTDHHYLAVGEDRGLFDPTASQFAWDGEPGMERYYVHDGRSYIEWREAEDAVGPLVWTPAPPNATDLIRQRLRRRW